jgi:anti-anti-sigma regulatory factor
LRVGGLGVEVCVNAQRLYGEIVVNPGDWITIEDAFVDVLPLTDVRPPEIVYETGARGTADHFRITQQRFGGVVVLTLEGEVPFRGLQCLEHIESLAAGGATSIVIDLQAVRADKYVIANLARTLLLSRQIGFGLRLANVGPKMHNTLAIAKLLPEFTICPSVEDAIRSFSS